MLLVRRIRNIIYTVFYKFFYLLSRQEKICFVYGVGSRMYSNLEPVRQRAKAEYPVSIIDGKSDFFISALKKIAGARIVLLDQSCPYISGVTIGKNTTCIQCWHAGGAYKKVGFDARRHGYSQAKENRRIARLHRNIDYFICSSDHVADIYTRAFNLCQQQMLVFGLPRMDAVIAKIEAASRTSDMPKSERIVILYAPTFRTNPKGKRYMPTPPDAASLRQALCDLGEICLAYRSHPSVANDVPPPGWENWTDMPQAEALSRASVLITDFSSVFFDFLIYNRPVVFYLQDLDNYMANNRELYFDPMQFFPDTVCSEPVQLETVLKIYTGKTMDYDSFWRMEMGACDGHSTQRLYSFIKQIMDGTNA